jgi:hypothetical protein
MVTAKERKMNGHRIVFGAMLAGVLAFGLVMAGCSSGGGGGTGTEGATVTGVTVSPSMASVAPGKNKAFSATGQGTNNPAQTVIWTVSGGGTGTSMNASGVLTVGASETATSLTVRAASTVDSSKSGTAAVTVGSGGSSGTDYTSALIGMWRTREEITGTGSSMDGNAVVIDLTFTKTTLTLATSISLIT